MERNDAFHVVFDANVVVSALLFSHGSLSWLREAWAQGSVVPVTNRSTLRELTRVLAYPRFRLTADDRHEILGDYVPFVRNHTPALASTNNSNRPACRDPHDQIFVDLAIATDADALVSGDQPILDMAEVLTIPVWSPIQLKEAWSGRT